MNCPDENARFACTSYFNAVAHLEELVYSLRDRMRKVEHLPEGVRMHLDRACTLLTQVRRFENPDSRPLKRVGIFGVPKQGKSSILNALLGVDILPTDKLPATNTLVDLHDVAENEVPGNPQPWAITKIDAVGFEQTETYASVDELRKPLELCAARGDDPNNQRPTPRRVVVHGPFHRTSSAFAGAMFMDTPGAEVEFEDDDDEPLVRESKRALEALEEANVILFCTKANCLGAKNTHRFYNDLMKRLSPLTIVNFLDKWEEQDEDPCEHACRKYGCTMDRTLAVSAKYAYDAGLNPESRDQAMWEKSRFFHLEQAIGRELHRLEPDMAIAEVLHNLETLYKNHPHLPLEPSKLEMDNFIRTLEDARDKGGANGTRWSKSVDCATRIFKRRR